MRALCAFLIALLASPAYAAPPARIIDGRQVMRRERPPHDGKGMSTNYAITSAVPDRSFEFRRRVIDPGGAIGLHAVAFDEIYYAVAGEGIVTAGGKEIPLRPGQAAYLYKGDMFGIRQVGTAPLDLIITYPSVDQPAQR